MPASIAFAESEDSSPRLIVAAPEPFAWGRVTPVTVELHLPPSALAIAAANPKPVQVRASILGCLVDQPEVTLDPVRGPKATWHITPLAQQARLNGCVEIVENGETVQRVELKPRMKRRHLTTALVIAAVIAPLGWWWLSAADGSAVAATIQARLPSLGGVSSAAARAVRGLIETAGPIEREWHSGFWLGLVLAASAAAAAWWNHPKTRALVSIPLLSAAPTPSARMRKLPPYLTRVTPEELAQPGQ